jgi:hypothetical protein
MDDFAQRIMVALGAIAAFASAGHLIMISIKRPMWRTTRWLYRFVSVVIVWAGVVYILALTNIIVFARYGYYIRPTIPLIMLAPTFIDISYRRGHNGSELH